MYLYECLYLSVKFPFTLSIYKFFLPHLCCWCSIIVRNLINVKLLSSAQLASFSPHSILPHSCTACQWLPMRWFAPVLTVSREFWPRVQHPVWTCQGGFPEPRRELNKPGCTSGWEMGGADGGKQRPVRRALVP